MSKKKFKFTKLQKKWLKALESGDYTQGEGYMKAVDGGKDFFCCLGVACDVYDSSRWGKKPNDEGSFAYKTNQEVKD